MTRAGTDASHAADFDPLDLEMIGDPHPGYARLRQSCPLARGGRWGGFWALLSYDAAVWASTRPDTFSSADGIVIPRNPVAGRRAPMHYDPPEHTRYRRALNSPFRAERVADLEPDVRAIARDLLAGINSAGSVELVSAFASPFATRVLTRFLNLGAEDARRIQTLSEQFERAQMAEDVALAESTSAALYGVARDAVAARRVVPLPAEDDVISGLIAVGGEMDDEFVAGTVRQLLIAGHVPVTLSLASAVRHLAADIELQQTLRDNPDRLGDAVEELLRLYTPNSGFSRTATRTVRMHGRTIEPGERVALVYTAANRDPSVFSEPDRFVLGREPNRHLAFGHGVHKCVGITLARLELKVALNELLAAWWFEPAGEPIWSHWPEYGPHTVPLRLTHANQED
jgi:cytochrome P450